MHPVALFVFIPFCKIHCTYCDFNVYANLARVMEPYADAVAREIAVVGARHSPNVDSTTINSALDQSDSADQQSLANASPLRMPAKSIFLGGGTPSLMSISQLEKIFRAFRESFAIASGAEITLEANPGTMDAAKLRDLRALGINRLSIGVQAFDDATLKRLNRGHTVADAMQTYDDARRAGYDNINLDFIYGLPLQTLDDWRATIERALTLAPEHLSLYALKVEEGTGLEFQIEHKKYPMPDDDLAAEMYTLAEEKLDAAGYEHYEISNWARRVRADHPERSAAQSKDSPLQSRHNLTYWLNQPYLGFGAGAHSYFNGKRYWNILSPLEYIAQVGRGETVVGGSETIERATEMAETMFLGLRLARGVVFEEFSARVGEDAREKYAAQFEELEKLGLIEFENERPDRLLTRKPVRSGVRLTPRGRLLSNEVFWRFLP